MDDRRPPSESRTDRHSWSQGPCIIGQIHKPTIDPYDNGIRIFYPDREDFGAELGGRRILPGSRRW